LKIHDLGDTKGCLLWKDYVQYRSKRGGGVEWVECDHEFSEEMTNPRATASAMAARQREWDEASALDRAISKTIAVTRKIRVCAFI